MERFKELVIKSRNFLGEASQSQIEQDHAKILAFATAHPELVDNFFHAAELDEDWMTLVENGEIAYNIAKISDMKISDDAKKAIKPMIQPMNWGGSRGRVAVIKVTL